MTVASGGGPSGEPLEVVVLDADGRSVEVGLYADGVVWSPSAADAVALSALAGSDGQDLVAVFCSALSSSQQASGRRRRGDEVTALWAAWSAVEDFDDWPVADPVDDLWLAAAHWSHQVRAWPAREPDSPAELLVRLARDPVLDVALWVAGNSGAPAEALEALAGHESWIVLSTLASNPACPPGVLVALSSHPDEALREEAQANPSHPRNRP